MDVIKAIHSRYSQGEVKPDPVPRVLIEKLLSAAVQAPNHYKVRPWRLVVITGKGRERLGDVMAASLHEKHPDLTAEALDKTRALALRAPLLIALGVDKPADARVLEIENISAVSAACQNLLLAAHAEGLGAKWRTGEWVGDPLVKEFLGLASDQLIVGFIYVGYPMFTPEGVERPSFQDRTTWLD